MITPEDLYTFLVQSGARVSKYPDSFRVGHPGGAIVTVEGYINLTDVVARINRAVDKQKSKPSPALDEAITHFGLRARKDQHKYLLAHFEKVVAELRREALRGYQDEFDLEATEGFDAAITGGALLAELKRLLEQ